MSNDKSASASPKKEALGGTGASSKRLVGWDKFVRHNPRSDRFQMDDFDHLEIYCQDATNCARRFATAFGFQLSAMSDVVTGNQTYASYVVGSGTIKFCFTAPYWTDCPQPVRDDFFNTWADYDKEDAWSFIKKHGMAVKYVGLQVQSAKDAYEQCVANGGTGVTKPRTVKDANGSITYSEVQYYEDIVLRFVEGRSTFKGNFFPGYQNEERKDISYGLHRIDHVVSNVPELLKVTDHVNKMLGFHEFGEFTAEDVGTVDSGLNSMVMANNEQTILLPVNEPTFGTRRKSQIQSYLEHHRGPGIQHIAITTPDIIDTIEKMTNQSPYGGVEFMPNPGHAYYRDHVPAKMKGLVSQDLINACEKYSILIDRDEEGGLLQIFTKPLLDRPTLFIEIIQRVGCPVDGNPKKQKPACGGFGKGNFGALFKSIEDWEKKLDGDEK